MFRNFSEKGKWPEVSKTVNPKNLQILTFCDKKMLQNRNPQNLQVFTLKIAQSLKISSVVCNTSTHRFARMT